MKNTLKVLGIIVLVLTIGFSFITCDDGNGGNGGEVPPEQKTTAERWRTWIDSTTSVTIQNSVASDGVNTITIAGTAAPNKWDGTSIYDYTAKQGKSYTYTFEAWTTSPTTRTLNIQYYNDWPTKILEIEQAITSKKITYNFVGEALPKGDVRAIEFRDASTLGQFCVKIISIIEN